MIYLLEHLMLGFVVTLYMLMIAAFIVMCYQWWGMIVIPITILFFCATVGITYLLWRYNE